MENTLLVLSLILFTAFIIGMFKPSAVIKKGKTSRGKVLLFFLLPSFMCFVFVGVIGNQQTKEALKNPEGVEELRLTSKNYTQVPGLLNDFSDLKILSLRNNEIESLDETILEMPLLEELDLSSNPLKEIPGWIIQLSNLKKLNLNNTKIDSIPVSVSSMIAEITYKGTPFEKALDQRRDGGDKGLVEDDNGQIDTGEESFGDFAIRKLLGNEHGYKKSFKKGDLYYIKPVTDVQVDSLGVFLTEAGFFNDDQEVSMQITYNLRLDTPVYELRAITEKQLNDDIKNAFKLQAMLISFRVFDGVPVDFHLCDKEFNTHTILKSGE